MVAKICYVLCLVAQLYVTVCDPVDRSPPGSSVHGNSPGKNTGVGCHALLQGIFPTQGANPGRFFTIWATREAPKSVINELAFYSDCIILKKGIQKGALAYTYTQV